MRYADLLPAAGPRRFNIAKQIVCTIIAVVVVSVRMDAKSSGCRDATEEAVRT